MTQSAEIRFLPVCSKCNKIIYEYIDCREKEILLFPDDIHETPRYKEYDLYPERCPNCGEQFSRIVMPTNVPFDNRI